MRLVTKGQEETKLTDKRSLLHSVKSDAEMLTKNFLKEAESSINTVLERPPVYALGENWPLSRSGKLPEFSS